MQQEMGLPTDQYWEDVLKKGPPKWFEKAMEEGKMPEPPGELENEKQEVSDAAEGTSAEGQQLSAGERRRRDSGYPMRRGGERRSEQSEAVGRERAWR